MYQMRKSEIESQIPVELIYVVNQARVFIAYILKQIEKHGKSLMKTDLRFLDMSPLAS